MGFDTINIADFQGSFRSLNGYANEYIAIGRALQAGYVVSFRAFRDAPYDAIIDYRGTLFRAEIKGTTGTSLNVTSGGRSGEQISRIAESREHIVRDEDCEFVIGVDAHTANCYIIPTELLSILQRTTLPLSALNLFKEKWSVFKGLASPFTPEFLKGGLSQLSMEELQDFVEHYNIPQKNSSAYPWWGIRGGALTSPISDRDALVLDIWKFIYLCSDQVLECPNCSSRAISITTNETMIGTINNERITISSPKYQSLSDIDMDDAECECSGCQEPIPNYALEARS